MDTPLLVGCEEVKRLFRVAVGLGVQQRFGRFGVDGWAIHKKALTESSHPLVIKIELLATGQGAPGDKLVHVGVAGVVRHVFIFQSRPGRAGDDLARLRHDIPEADLFIFFIQCQVRVIQPGEFRQCSPCLDGDLAVGFRRQGQNHFRRINRAFNLRPACVSAIDVLVVQITQERHFFFSVPVDALAAVTQLVHQWPKRGKTSVGVRVIPLDSNKVRCCFARNQLTLAFLPVFYIKWLTQLCRRIVHQRQGNHVFLDTQVTFGRL